MSPISISRLAAMAVAISALAAQPDPLASRWRFAVGKAGESLHAVARDMPPAAAEVTLPHRALHPNSAMWYARTLDLPAHASITVEADDGAQVFVDGTRWNHDRRGFFPPAPVAPGPRAVVIRVLNNAMQGGLRRVIVSDGRPAPTAATVPERPRGFDPPESLSFRERMPPAPVPCDFTLWADSQGGWDTFAALVSRMGDRPHHFSAGLGDLVNDGSDPAAWARFAATLAPLATRVPVVPIVGNHDYDGFYNDLVSHWYLRLFGRDTTWMAWSCGPARFVALDLNTQFPIGVSPGSAQHAWLRREVASDEWREAAWRVLLVHQPPYSRSWAGYDGDEAVRTIVRDLVGHGLQMVVSGHSHAYEHLMRTVAGRPLHVLITGGAGGGLEDPLAAPVAEPDRVIVEHHFVRARTSGSALTVEAVDRNGAVLDRWSVAR